MAGSRSGSAALLLLVALLCGTCVQGAQQRSSHGSSSRSSQQQQQQQHIPRIIHRNYMGGVAALQAATAGPQPDFKAHWLGSCTVRSRRRGAPACVACVMGACHLNLQLFI